MSESSTNNLDISIFPTAFFLVAAYSETTFLFFTILTFYNLHRGNWWLAGLFGLLTSLSRFSGLLLLLPFYYEYLVQHDFTFKKFPLKILRLLSVKDWSYLIFTGTLYLFFLMEPVYPSAYPLQSTGRYMLALFPAFILLARIGKNRAFHYHYIFISASLLFLMLTRFLAGSWIV